MNRISERTKDMTAKVKINGLKKEFIVDTGSAMSLMTNGNIIKSTETQKVENRNQDVNKTKYIFGKRYMQILNRRTTNGTKQQYTSTQNGQDENFQSNNQRHPIGRKQPIR